MAQTKCDMCDAMKDNSHVICLHYLNGSQENVCDTCEPSYQAELAALWGNPNIKLSAVVIKKLNS